MGKILNFQSAFMEKAQYEKFKNISASQILREINFGPNQSLKNAHFDNVRVSDFKILDNCGNF